jgi:hypothetical protein
MNYEAREKIPAGQTPPEPPLSEGSVSTSPDPQQTENVILTDRLEIESIQLTNWVF